jgi:hypothetical protein
MEPARRAGKETEHRIGEVMVIYLDDYRKVRTAPLPVLRAEEQLLCVNWNPAFGAIALSCYQTPQELSPELPDEGAMVQPEFMTRVYALASQI